MPASALSQGLRLWLYDPEGDGADDAQAHPPILAVLAPLSTRTLLETFSEHRHEWFPGSVHDSADRIADLLDAEHDLSRRWKGLPGTEHPQYWQPEAQNEAQRRERERRATILSGVRDRRLALWHPPLWWVMPFVRHRPRHLRLDLMLASSLGELEAMAANAVPREWQRSPVRVRLEVETRVYWGARSRSASQKEKQQLADGTHGRARFASSPVWQPCRVRGDGITTSEDLFTLRHGRIVEGSLPSTQLTRHLQRHLHGGVGLLVVVPVLVFEREPRWHERARGQLVRWRRAAWRRAGWAHRDDRDPTFEHRLEHDEPFWLAGTGAAPLDATAWDGALQDGALLRPASRAAVAHLPQQAHFTVRSHVVMVHGGLSSVRGSFADWLTDAPAANGPLWLHMPVLEPQLVWRFEHDSFLPILHNIARLERWLARMVIGTAPRGEMVLVAHSRGGAVVRFALERLRRRWPGWVFHALTTGAPHLGTQVFRRIGHRWAAMATLIRAARSVGSGWLGPEQLAQLLILERGLSYDIPPGFRDVEPKSIKRLAGGHPEALPQGMWLWGSAWGPEDAHPIEEGVWHWLVEDIGGAEVGGDGLVALESALAGRAVADLIAHDASPVFHTQYFGHGPTREQMARVLAQLLDETA